MISIVEFIIRLSRGKFPAPRISVVGGFRLRFVSAGRGFDYYCCRLRDVILRGDLGWTGLKSRSHAIDSAYIEMKSLAVRRSNRSFALEFVESNIIGHAARSWFRIDEGPIAALSNSDPRYEFYQPLRAVSRSRRLRSRFRIVPYMKRRIITAKLLILNRCPKAQSDH